MELRRVGLTSVAHALHAATENHLAPDEVLSLIAFWEKSKPAWQVGALFFRIRNGFRGQPQHEGWPEKSKSAVLYPSVDPPSPWDIEQELRKAKLADKEFEESRGAFMALAPEDRERIVESAISGNRYLRNSHARAGLDSKLVMQACLKIFRTREKSA